MNPGLVHLGWKPHTAESRARIRFASQPPVKRAVGARPRKFSLRYLCTLLDQLALGSCTAQAAAQVIRMACAAAGISDPVLISRLAAYYLARVRAGEQAIDAGSQVGTVFDVLADGGCAPEWSWAYDITRFDQMPDTNAFRLAYDFRGTVGVEYSEVPGEGTDAVIDNICDALLSARGVAFGSIVTADYTDGPTGIIHVNPKATIVGGHAQTIIGYNDDQEYVEVLGSWGNFGEPGQEPGVSRFGYDYVKAEFSDLWVVNKAPNIPTQVTT